MPLRPSALAPPPPAAVVQPPRLGPQMTFRAISPAGGGYYTGESTCVGQHNCPGKNASSLAQCQALCLAMGTRAGNAYESCMGPSRAKSLRRALLMPLQSRVTLSLR